jgi:hypothetical protein
MGEETRRHFHQTLTAMNTTLHEPVALREAEIPLWRSILPLVLVVAIVGLCLLSGRPSSTSEAGVMMNLPYKVGMFWGKREEASLAEKNILPPDTLIERKLYSDLFQNGIQCSIVLSGVERRSIHRPEVCLPGQGWLIRKREIVPVTLASGKVLKVKQLTLEREVVIGPGQTRKIQSLFYYWFVGKNITTPDHYARALRSSWDQIVHGINHRWAYVSVTSLVGSTIRQDGKNLEETQTMLQDFIREAVPCFQVSEMSPEAFQQAVSNPGR